MTIERLEELKEWFHDVAGRLVSTFHAENCYLIDYLIEAEIDRQSVTDCHGLRDEEILDTLDWERDNLHFIESSPRDEWTERNAKRKRITIQALKRQTPKKPMLAEENSWGIKKEQDMCPECFNFLPHYGFAFQSRKLTYCDICGQAIDWSEE